MLKIELNLPTASGIAMKVFEFEFEGVKFYVGKSAKENWELLDKAKAEDQNYIWFHLESFPSPYVVMWSSISNLEKLIKENTSLSIARNKNIKLATANAIAEYLSFGANLCKEHSKYKAMNDAKIMYTTVKKITKTDKVGEVDIKGKYLTLVVGDTPTPP